MSYVVLFSRISIVLALCGILHAQDVVQAGTPDDLAARLHRTEKLTSLDDPSLHPWHLKMEVQAFDPKGKMTEEGTLEEWWTPDTDRWVYSFPSYTATHVKVKGVQYATAHKGTTPYLFSLVRNQVVHPISIEGPKSDTLDLRRTTFDPITLDCISIEHVVGGKLPALGVFPAYCLEPDHDRMRVFIRSQSQNVSRNGTGRFQDHEVATDITVNVNQAKAMHGHVIALDTRTLPADELSSIDGLEPSNTPAERVSAGVMAGNILTKITPEYPPIARAAHISGSVVLHAIIGIDGRVSSLTVVSSPSPVLSDAAKDAVRQWAYRPYLLNGAPVEVDTTITVNFNFGSSSPMDFGAPGNAPNLGS
jgi:TonB family protein